jgi:hypothetical protein
MRLPQPVRKRINPKKIAKADVAGWVVVLAAQTQLPEVQTGALPTGVPKGPMPDASTRTSAADTFVEGALHFAVEDGLAGLIYLAVI